MSHGRNIGKSIREYICTSSKLKVKNGGEITDRKNEQDLVANKDNFMV
jgi:hypothetical protein